MALFAPDSENDGTDEPRLLAIKYLHITNDHMEMDKIRTKLHELRGHSAAQDHQKEEQQVHSM